jgi:hypothetical protein
MQWIKMYTSLLLDPDIGSLNSEEFTFYFRLYLYAGWLNEGGWLSTNGVYLSPWQLKEYACANLHNDPPNVDVKVENMWVREDDIETVRILKRLVNLGFIEAVYKEGEENKNFCDSDTNPDQFAFRICRWDSEQSDMLKKAEDNRKRQAAFKAREKQKTKQE